MKENNIAFILYNCSSKFRLNVDAGEIIYVNGNDFPGDINTTLRNLHESFEYIVLIIGTVDIISGCLTELTDLLAREEKNGIVISRSGSNGPFSLGGNTA